MLVYFCMKNDLKIINGFYQKKYSHKYKRYRWNNITGEFDQKSVIDYFIVSGRRIIQYVKVIARGSGLCSDHRLLLADLEIRLQKLKVKEKISAIKADKLKERHSKGIPAKDGGILGCCAGGGGS